MAASGSLGKRVRVMLIRIGLGTATILLSVNLWTGFPLLALWVGSQAAGGDPLAMTGIVAMLLTLIALSVIGVKTLARISESYDRVTNRPPATRQPAPWLRSATAQKIAPQPGRREITAVEMIVIAAVVVAFFLFEYWFFFLASRPV